MHRCGPSRAPCCTASAAGAAFEAYLDPTGAKGYQELHSSGVETTYTDKDLLVSSFAGILQVLLPRECCC